MTSKRFGTAICLGLIALVIAAAPVAVSAADETDAIAIAAVDHDGPVNFSKEILPILRRKCLACHNATEAESDLVLETPRSILKGGAEGPAVVANNSGESLLLKLASRQTEPVMPPDDNDVGAKKLTPQELGLIKLWIDQGAQSSAADEVESVNWQPLPSGVNPIFAVAISPDGQYAAAGRANQIFIYHVPSRREVGRLTDPALLKSGVYSKPGVAHFDLVQSLAFSPDSRRLASGGFRTVKLWRRSENRQIAKLAGLEGPTRSLAVSADGRWAAVGEESGKIKLIDLTTGKLGKTLTGHGAAVTSLCFSADGGQLVSGSQDKTIRLYGIGDGKQIGSPIDVPAPINAVALVAGGKQIAAGGTDNIIRTWHLPGSSADATSSGPIKELKGHGGPVTSLAAILPSGEQLVSGSQDGTVRIWNVAAGKQVRSINHGGPVVAVAVRMDGQRIASVSINNTAKLYNTADGKQVAELKGDFRLRIALDDVTRAVALAKRNVDSAKTDLDGANKRKAAEEANLKKAQESLEKAITDLAKKVEAAKKPLADKEVGDKALAQANAALAEAEKAQKSAAAAAAMAADALAKAQAELAKARGDKKSLAEQAVAAATAKKKTADAAQKQADQQLAEAQNAVKKEEANVKKLADAARKASEDTTAAERAKTAAQRSVQRAKQLVEKATAAVPGFQAALDGRQVTAKQVDAKLAKAKQAAADGQQPLRAAAFSPDGATLATAGDDAVVHTWDSETGAAVETIGSHAAPIVAVGFTADGNIVAASQNGSAAVWDAHVRWSLERAIGTVDSSDTLVDRVTALAFSPDGRRLAAGGGEPSRSGELKIFNVADGNLSLAIEESHSDTVFGVEFSPDGKYIASCGADRFLKTFDAASGKFVRSFEGHTHHVLGVSWRADGRILASCGADNVIKVWNFLTGDQKRTLTGFNKEVTSIHFLAVGDNVLASCGDRSITIKRTDNGGNIRSLSGGGDFMYSARASGDGKTIVAGGQDSVLRIWDDAGKVIATFEAPQPQQTASRAASSK